METMKLIGTVIITVVGFFVRTGMLIFMVMCWNVKATILKFLGFKGQNRVFMQKLDRAFSYLLEDGVNSLEKIGGRKLTDKEVEELFEDL